MKPFQVDLLKPLDAGELLSLQKSNLRNNIEVAQMNAEGFLTFEYSEEVILKMLADMPQPVARNTNGELIGYALATSLKVASQMELIEPLIQICERINFNYKPLKEQPYYFMGQVCVKAGWRGLGVFDALYNKHRELFSEKYNCVITEVAEENARSMAAHKRVGFITIEKYHGDNNLWHVVAWNFKRGK